MTLRFEAIVVDANDPAALASFWQALLGWHPTGDEDGDVTLRPPNGEVGPELYFGRVPEGKQVKNRLHLDFRPDDQGAEVARAESLGARRVSVGQSDDVTWVVLADPEGNEFCILRALDPEELAEG